MDTPRDDFDCRPLDGAHASSETLALAQEMENGRKFSRTPRPYHQAATDIQQEPKYAHLMLPGNHGRVVMPSAGEHGNDAAPRAWQRQSDLSSASTTSDSGTEADDEKAFFVKALPSSALRPRKGLKTGEEDEDALLTPGQLDEKERTLQGYFSSPAADTHKQRAQREREEQEKLFKRRFAEFVRRSSEVALMAVILATVLCGRGVASIAWLWRWELLSHFASIIALISIYPVKLSIVDTKAARASVWQKFRVPASFDPATILYPPLLPVLVALSIGPAYPAVILPNMILGLASLPQRLFPRSSRLGGFNALHWLVALVPLVVSENTTWLARISPAPPYLLKAAYGLSPETLVALYPLHHALLQPLQYLTTTSLLVSELHLLSTVLINLLLLAASPQTVIMKACLWIGGVSVFLVCGPLLHWNVTLARIPRWKLRRPGHSADERKSLVDAVTELISVQRAAAAFSPARGVAESDADEDYVGDSSKRKVNGKRRLDSQCTLPTFHVNMGRSNSSVESAQSNHASFPTDVDSTTRPRRNTVPTRGPPETPTRHASSRRRREKTRSLLWCLQLTPDQAKKRKWVYAALIYITILGIILLPVKNSVSSRALYGQEPIGWAIGYLFAQIPSVCMMISSLGLESWVPLPEGSQSDWSGVSLSTYPFLIDRLRLDLGAGNVRLLLVAYWVGVLFIGLLTVFSLTAFVEVDTRRKVFHGVMVAMFLPATYIDPCFCSLATALVLGVFLLLEVIRAGQVWPLGNAIGRFVAPYVDGRDLRGPVVVSHIFLLIGCAVPLWFSLASIERAGDMPWKDWELRNHGRETAMVAGVICVGMGDAAASLIGRRYGRRKWIWVGGKSLEGSAAFAAAVTMGLIIAKGWQAFGGWNDICGSDKTRSNWTRVGWDWGITLLKAVFCACGASFMEAVLTGANDNVVVPVALWLLVKGVRL